MAKNELSGLFQEIADLMEILGENRFKIRAYQNAARTIDGVSDSLVKRVRSGKLEDLPGIGEGLANKIEEYFKTGRIRFHEDLRKKVPKGLLKMLKIAGMGPRKAGAVWKGLKITTVGELEYACTENRLMALEGFGPKSQEKILKGIAYFKKNQGRFLYAVAIRSAEACLKKLQKHPAAARVSIAGSLRRKKEIIKDIDFVASTKKPKLLMKFFTQMEEVESIIAQGHTKSSVTLKNGINVDLRAVTEKEFPYALHHLTGSKEHNTALRTRAKKAGYKINEYGLFKGRRFISCKDEAQIYARLKLAYIDPELREDMGEIDASAQGKLPKLLSAKDLRGIFHVHTTYSDGSASVEEMVHTAERLGFEYVGISDHSKSAVYANGLTEDRIKKQHTEIAALNKKLKKIHIFKGTECDILPDGSMDFSDRTLAAFDFCIASVHSRFNMTKHEMTKRITRALKNKYVNMLGHATGRLLLAREEYPVDLNEVIRVAIGEGKVIEVNASPYRLDLDWRLLKVARQRGLKVSINPDAHSPEGLSDTVYGVGIARKGWLRSRDVVNTLPREKMRAFLKRQRNGR